MYNFKHLEYDFKYVKFDIFSVLYVQKICSGELLPRSLHTGRNFFRNTGRWCIYRLYIDHLHLKFDKTYDLTFNNVTTLYVWGYWSTDKYWTKY